MAQTYPFPFVSGLDGSPRATVEADASHLLPLLDKHQSLTIFTRSHPNFEDICQTCNKAITITPLAVVRPRTEAEVSSVIIHCAESVPRTLLSIRAGGHDNFGRGLVENGVVIDLRAMDHIDVTEDGSSARIGGGVTGGTLLKYLDALGLATPTGLCTGVGYAGWALGGGYGVLQGKYGLGCDQILAARVVTASGAIVDTKDDPELLWALRGAGNGNFGAVVELTIKIYPRPVMLAGNIAFSLTDGQQVLAKFKQLIAADFPDEFSGDFICGFVPGLGHAIMILYAWVQAEGDLTRARAHLKKVQDIGNVLKNTVIESKYSWRVSITFSAIDM